MSESHPGSLHNVGKIRLFVRTMREVRDLISNLNNTFTISVVPTSIEETHPLFKKAQEENFHPTMQDVIKYPSLAWRFRMNGAFVGREKVMAFISEKVAKIEEGKDTMADLRSKILANISQDDFKKALEQYGE